MLDQQSLLNELTQAKDRIEELEHLLGMKKPKPRLFKDMPSLGWNLLCLLVKHELVTRDLAFTALYGHKAESDQPKDIRIIDTNVSRLNRRIRPTRIKCDVERGYFLEKHDRQRLKAVMGG